MGHRSINTTQVYLGRTDTQRKQAISRLEATHDEETNTQEKNSHDSELKEALSEVMKEIKTWKDADAAILPIVYDTKKTKAKSD